MTVPRTPQEFFETYVPARLGAFGSALAGRSSAGSVVVRFDDGSAWHFRLRNGLVEGAVGGAEDAVVQLFAPRSSFEPIFVKGAERDEATPLGGDRRASMAQLLAIDEDRANLIRNTPGSVAIVIKDGAEEHCIVALAGAGELTTPTCTLRLGMGDFEDLLAGRVQPIQLLMTGQLVVEGDAQSILGLGVALMG